MATPNHTPPPICPAWCMNDHSLDLDVIMLVHGAHVGEMNLSGDAAESAKITVRLTSCGDDEFPLIALHNEASDFLRSTSEVVTWIPISEATPFAVLLDTLGRGDLAEIVRQAARMAEAGR